MNFSNTTTKRLTNLVKWILLGAGLGVAGGILGTAFHYAVDEVTHLREHNPYILLFLPLGGLAISALYSLFRKHGNMDTKRVFEGVKRDREIPICMLPLIFISTVITHMLGGSAGREGAALQLGGSLGYKVGEASKQDAIGKRMLTVAGMSSVFSALFGTPLAAAFFPLEVTREGTPHWGSLLLAILSSFSAYFVAMALGVEPVRFVLPAFDYQAEVFLKVLLLSALCAAVCILFAVSLHKTEKILEKCMPGGHVRAFAGGVLLVLLTIALKTTDYNGAGMGIIENAIAGHAESAAFLLKIIFTAITVAAGFKGGEIVPTFFIGATFGCFMGGFLGMDAGVGASLGLIALFSGMTKCPLAALLLAIEVFGGKGIPLFIIAVLISYICSGRFGLYDNAKTHGKIHAPKADTGKNVYL